MRYSNGNLDKSTKNNSHTEIDESIMLTSRKSNCWCINKHVFWVLIRAVC